MNPVGNFMFDTIVIMVFVNVVVCMVDFGGRLSRRLEKYHVFCLSRFCWGGWAGVGWGGKITFLGLVHTVDARPLFGVGWVGGW